MRNNLLVAIKSVVMVALIAAPAAVLAGSNLDAGGVADNLSENANAFFGLALKVFQLVGLCLAGLGLWLWYKDTKQPGQDNMKKAVVAFVVGVCLLVLPSIVDVGANTVVNGSESASGAINRRL